MKTMCPSGYHHNGFVATHALGYMVCVCVCVCVCVYIYMYIMHFSLRLTELIKVNNCDLALMLCCLDVFIISDL